MVCRAFAFQLYRSNRLRHLYAQIDVAAEIYNHVIAVHKRYYRRYGGYVGCFRSSLLQPQESEASGGRAQGRGGIAMLIAHCIAPALHNAQATSFARAAGCARFAYNWALATLSTGEQEPGPKPHTALLKRVKRLSRSLSRKQ